MDQIGYDALFEEIETYWGRFFARDLEEAEREWRARREAAEVARQRLIQDQQKKVDLEEAIHSKRGEQARCQQRRQTHAQRMEENSNHLAVAERQVEDARLQVRRAEEEVTYAKRRCLDLESSPPVQSSNYEAELEAHHEYVSVLDDKIEELQSRLKHVVTSTGAGTDAAAHVQRLEELIDEVQLKRDLEKPPIEDRAYQQRLEQFEKSLADARDEYASARVTRDEAVEGLESALAKLSNYKHYREELALEPERDRRAERLAREQELELVAQIKSLQITFTAQEGRLIQQESDAFQKLQQVKQTVEQQIENTAKRLTESSISRSGVLAEIETLTSKRDTARKLWKKAILVVEERIRVGVSPNLPALRRELNTAEQQILKTQNKIKKKFDQLELSAEEEHTLRESFTREQEIVLDSGKQITYRQEVSKTEGVLYVLVGILFVVGAPPLLKAIYAPESDWVWAGTLSTIFGVLLGLIAISVIIVARMRCRPTYTVTRSVRPDGSIDFNDTGHKYRNYERALKHRELQRSLKKWETETQRARQSYEEAFKRGDKKVTEWLPSDYLRNPILSDDSLAPIVKDLRGELVAASVGNSQWPVIDLQPFKARYKPDAKGYDDVWDTWSARLQEQGLEAFLPQL